MLENYLAAYERLNGEQKSAVDTIHGPVMVIAGPGTGKTQILSLRILNILQTTDAKPNEILCLTFTEAGAHAMRKRLSQFLGALAYDIEIHTFHGLANKIILENNDSFSEIKKMRLIEEIEVNQTIEKILRGLPSGHPLLSFSENIKSNIDQLKSLFSILKEEKLDIVKLQEHIAQLSEPENYKLAFPQDLYRANRGNFKKGDLKQKEYEDTLQYWNKLLLAAELQLEYEKVKKDNGWYEINNMIETVVEQFEQNTTLLQYYQEQFQFVLVDEYQDTNALQNEMLYAIISHWEENPDCFVVGDDDQAIYRFQGANPENMLEFKLKFSCFVKVIVLEKNYRSTASIIKLAQSTIALNRDRLINHLPGLSKNLIAINSKETELKHFSFPTALHEAQYLANRIQHHFNEDTIPYFENAVLYTQHKDADILCEVFLENNIPFQLTKKINVLETSQIKYCCKWLEYLSCELTKAHSGEHLLYELMLHPNLKFRPIEVSNLAFAIAKNSTHENPCYWRNFLNEKSKEVQTNLFSEFNADFTRFFHSIEELISKSSQFNWPQILIEIYNQFGLVENAIQSKNSSWELETLHTFLDFVKKQNQKNPFEKLTELISILNQMKLYQIGIDIERRIGDKNGVVFSTIFSSKGLEYENVFIINNESKRWEKRGSSKNPFRVRKIFSGLNELNGKQETGDLDDFERRRLLYVGITRAKKNLVISSNKFNFKGESLTVSKFIAEIQDLLQYEEILISTEKLSQIQSKILYHYNIPRVVLDDSSAIQNKIQNFKFSPTSLYSILECSVAFYYKHLLKLPGAPSAELAYGNAVHATLNQRILQWQESQTEISTEKFLEIFSFELFKRRGDFAKEAYELKRTQGFFELPLYLNQRKGNLQQGLHLTEKYYESNVNKVRIGGFLDHLIFNGNNCTIIDYKTGKLKNIIEKSKLPSEKKIQELGLPAPYWFQLCVYQLILESLPNKNWTVETAIIDPVSTDEKLEFDKINLHYTSDQKMYVLELIKLAHEKLSKSNFYEGCGKCSYCLMQKEFESRKIGLETED